MFDSYSQKIELWTILLFTLFAFCTETFWIQWATAAGVVLTMLIIGNMI